MKWTAEKIKNLKGSDKWAMLTAYDAITAEWVDENKIPAILVGDSLAMTTLGYDNTLPVKMSEMLHHTSAVSRVVKNSLIISDMPFMSYQSSISHGLENAGKFIKDSAADAVKIEGGIIRFNLIESLVTNGIPVLSHIGLTPQSIKQLGGYKIQGNNDKEYQKILDDAVAVEQAGSFAVVLECVPEELAKKITNTLSIPTIGIGAGVHCDAQILVISDLLGLTSKSIPSFAKSYVNLYSTISESIQEFKKDVKNNVFPADKNSF